MLFCTYGRDGVDCTVSVGMRAMGILHEAMKMGKIRVCQLYLIPGLLLLGVLTACARLAEPTAVAFEQPVSASADQPVAGTIDAQTLRYAAAKQVVFDAISLEEGLSQSVALEILQDSRGFLWIGTQDGLNRYDGYEFRVFKHSTTNPDSLSSNFINALAEDAEGQLWVGSNGRGLDRYDPASGKFVHFNTANSNLGDDFVNALFVDRDGVLWIGTGSGGLCRLVDSSTARFECYVNDPADENSLSNNTVLAIAQDGVGNLWVGTLGGGLNRLDPRRGQFARFRSDPARPDSLSSDSVQALAVDAAGAIWVGMANTGLDRLDPVTGSVSHYRHDPDDASSLGDDTIVALWIDADDVLWIGTNGGGLNTLELATQRWTRYRVDAADPTSLPNNQVWSIFQDDAGVYWFGTFGSGLARYDRARQKFAVYRNNPESATGLSSSQVWGFAEDRAGSLWIGTNGGGLNQFDPGNGKWSQYRNDPADPASLSGDWIMGIHEDAQGNLWVGAFGAELNRLDRATGEFARYADAVSTAVITEDSRSRLWIGGYGIGLGLYDRDADRFTFFTNDPTDAQSLSGNSVVSILEAPDGTLWLGLFGGGLNRFDPRTETAVRYQNDPLDLNSLASDVVLAMHQAADGTLWIGTDSGLDHFDPADGNWSHFTEENGLINSTIYAILEDDHGRLWLTHNKGLTRFNPETGTFTHFSERDGLQSNEFNQGAAYRSVTGELLFGGISGFNAFHPDLIVNSSYDPPIVVTEFQLFNQPVMPGADAPLRQTVETSDVINLTYRDDFFAFSFAALHLSAPELNQYAYILDGFDKAWNMVGTRRFASYTNVPPGDYTFRVRGTNSDGVWSAEEEAVRIVIPPPFWQTAWFRVLVVVGVTAVIAGAFYARVRSIEAQRRQLALLVDERTRELRETLVELERARDAAEAANRAKSVFLANMSHEFRTPLNAIMGFTQLMLREPQLDRDQYENLEVIHRSSEHLLGLINDVLELSKIEAGRAMLNPQPFDLHRMLFGLEEMFALRARDKGIELSVQLDEDVPRYVLADAGRLRQILLNLLGNAVKFTDHGRVDMHISASQGAQPEQYTIGFEVADTGPGVAPEEQATLFEPFVQAAAGQLSQEGTGLGLSISRQNARLMGGDIVLQSEPGRGSTFRLDMPCELVPETAVRQPPQRRRAIGLQPGQPEYRLLVVDDQPTNRQILVKLLAPLGFAVREATNGQEAITVWEEWAPQLIWMDMRMPVMNGYEATRRIKATTQGQATVIVALTASGMEEERAVILSEGCDDYIRKPFYEEELFAALAEHLGVQFIYSTLDDAAPAVGAAVYPDAGLVARAAALPADLSVRLEQAALLGDVAAIGEAIAQVDTRDAVLGATLAKWARDYDHERILRLLHAVRGEAHEREAVRP